MILASILSKRYYEFCFGNINKWRIDKSTKLWDQWSQILCRFIRVLDGLVMFYCPCYHHNMTVIWKLSRQGLELSLPTIGQNSLKKSSDSIAGKTSQWSPATIQSLHREDGLFDNDINVYCIRWWSNPLVKGSLAHNPLIIKTVENVRYNLIMLLHEKNLLL